MPVAIQRADHIAAAMHVEQCRVAIDLRGRGPLRPDSVCADRLDGDVARNAILQETCIHVLAALPVVIRTHSAGQLGAQRVDFRIAHVLLPSPAWWCQSVTLSWSTLLMYRPSPQFGEETT